MRRGSLFAGAMVFLLAGCMGYQLGPVGGKVAGAKSIQIEPFVNKTLEPRLGDALIVSMRKNLAQNGTYQLNTQESGDIILTGTITAFDRNPVTRSTRRRIDRARLRGPA